MAHHRRVQLANTPQAALLPSPAEMAGFDAATIKAGVSGIELMERAGERVARVICDLYQSRFGVDHPVTILCGPGNNGGDGLVVARGLRAHGCHVAVVMTGAAKYSPELTAQVGKCITLGEEFFVFSEDARGLDQPGRLLDLKTLRELLEASWMVVDALLGMGQKDAPHGVVRSVAQCLSEVRQAKGNSPKCIAIDVPTGINADTGEIYDPHVQADLTVSVELVKRGMLQYPAREACGEIRVVSADIKCEPVSEFSLVTRAEPVLKLNPRSPSSHKGDYGRVFVVGGSADMPGAPELAALAALRSGAGLVVKAEFGKGGPSGVPELLHANYPEGLAAAAVPDLLARMRQADCTIVGPGLGTSKAAAQAVLEVLKAIQAEGLPAVIDADALNILSESLRQGRAVKLPSAVLTPHPGEMARLLGLDGGAEVQKDRYAAARKLAGLLEAVVVLKGASSIIYTGSKGFVNLTGNPFMASAGSGDVLSGMIAGFVAQGKKLADAAVAGVYYHGAAGDQAQQKSRGPIIATDIIAAIPGALAAGML